MSASATFVVSLHVRIRRVRIIFNRLPNQRHGQRGIAGRQFRKQPQFSACRRIVRGLHLCDRRWLDGNAEFSQF